ncbi:MAG: hypothetical protein ACPHY8_01560 [Patescibacteria group bacterium]
MKFKIIKLNTASADIHQAVKIVLVLVIHFGSDEWSWINFANFFQINKNTTSSKSATNVTAY